MADSPPANRSRPSTPTSASAISALLYANATASANAVALRGRREGRWEQATWREFAALAATAAARAHAELPKGKPVVVVVDNGIPTVAALVGLFAAGVDLAVLEVDSSLLRDRGSVLYELGADTVVGPAGTPAGYRVLPADQLIHPPPEGDPLASLTTLANVNSAVWQSTSGSTGEPRLAEQTVANLVRGGEIYAERYRITERDTLLATVPMAHSFGLVGSLITALVTGASVRTLDGFSPLGAREAIEADATVLLGTPLVYELLTRSGRPASSKLRVALSSGGPLGPGVAQAARQRLGCPVHQVYGSTEMGIIASQFPGPHRWPDGCVGLPAPGVEIRLGDRPVPDEPGAELFVRTDTMFRGYWGRSGPVLDHDGWYATGDLAVVDPAGYLKLVRRKDSFINVGGRKVNPVRVERIVAEHDSVAQAVVYGVEATGGEQEVWAAVVFAGSGSVVELLDHCRARLAAYEVPYRVHVLDQLPRNGMGKVDRARLPRQP